MAEERVVRLRLERVGFDEAEKGAGALEVKLDRLATAEQKVGREGKPAAASVDRLRDSTGRFVKAAGEGTPKVDKLGDEIQKTGKQATTAGGQLDKAGAQMRGLGSFAGQMATKVVAAASAFLSFQIVKDILGDAITAIKEDEAATALLEARIRSTGGAAERSLEQLDALAGRLSRGTGIDDEAIKNAEIELQQFDRVYGDVFDRAIRLAADLGAVSGDVAGEITLLGKALQDPEEGIAGLEKNIGRLTDSQADLIKETAKLGDVQKAQQMLLDVVERRVGGTAEAYRDTLGGALRAASTEWENQLELLRTGLSPALRQIAEDFVRWSQSAEGQERIVQLGRDLGTVLRDAATLAKTLGENLDRLDSSAIGRIVDVGFKLADGLAAAQNALGPLADAFNPLMAYSLRVIDLIASGIEKVEAVAAAATGAIRRLDPRAAAGSAAGIISNQGGGMTDAQRKAWDEAEAAAYRSHQREQERHVDLARTAALEAKKLESARQSAAKLIEGIKQEAEQRQAALAILRQEGVSREDLIKQLRELEIQQKADAKVQEVRLAYLKAGKTLTDANAEAIRGWVREAEKATDAADAWAKARQQMSAVGGVDTSTLDARLADYVRRDQERRAASFAIDQANREAFDQQREDVRQQLEDQAAYFRESLASPHEELDRFNRQLDELAKVTDSTGQTVLDATKIEQLRADALAQYNMARIDEQMSAWGGLFSFLGGEFGGLFNQIASAIQGVQSGISTGRGVGQALGGTSSADALGGAFGGTVAAFIELYKLANAMIQKNKSERYGTSGAVDRTGNFDVLSYTGNVRNQIGQANLELARAIKGGIEALEDALRIGISDLGKIEIKVRNDGKSVQAWVEGLYLGTFSDVNSAIQAAALEALRSTPTASGLSELMKTGLANFTSPDTEGLMEFLQQLRQISDMSLSAGAIDLQTTLHQLDELWVALSSIGEVTAEVIEGFQNLAAGYVKAFQSWADSISGRQKTQQEILAEKEADKRLFEIQKQITINDLKLRVLELKGRIDNAKAMAEVANREGDIDAARLGQRAKYLDASIQLEGAAAHASLSFLQIWAEQVKALEQLIAELGNINVGDINLGPVNVGGGGVNLKDLRKGLLDEIKRLEAEAKGPLHAAFFDFQQSLKDFRERAKEAKLPAADLAAGIAALTESFKRSLLEQARTYAGQGTDFTARLAEVQKFFDELRELGRKKTGIENFRVDSLERQALQKLGGELQQAIAEFGGLANPMLAIQMQAADLQANLMAFAQAAGWSAEQIAAAQAAIDAGAEYQRQQGIDSILGRVFGVLEQAGLFEEERQEFERARIETEYALLEAQLRFYGAWTEQTEAWLNAARDIEIAGKKAGQSIESAGRQFKEDTTSSQDMANAWRQAVQDWRSAVRDFSEATRDLLTNDELTGLTQEQQLAAAEARMDDLAARALAGDVDALRALAAAREEFLSESRESYQGGSGYETAWQKAMITTAGLLSHAQETEAAVAQKAIQDALLGSQANADQITAAVYDGAAQVVAAIYRMMQGLPAYGEGGYVDRPHLAIVGDRPEYILPAVPGLRGPGTVSVAYGAPSTGRSDALLDEILREQRRHGPALRSTAYSSGSTARSSRSLVDAETRARVVAGRKR